jgi:P27 family predicted phage terminase small subunit
MVGRIPKPTKMHIMNGNPSRLNLDDRIEPEPDVKIPDCPRHLSKEAKKEWHRLSKELFAIGLISNVDRSAFAAYCQAYGRWVNSENKIKKTGDVIEAPSGYPIQNPYLSVSNKAVEQMHKFLTEFGMTPASRTRLAVTGKKKTTDPLEELLAGVN